MLLKIFNSLYLDYKMGFVLGLFSLKGENRVDVLGFGDSFVLYKNINKVIFKLIKNMNILE